MTFRLNVRWESSRLQESLDDLESHRTPEFRRRLTSRVLEQLISRVVARHPVETGRARRAWMDAVNQLRVGVREPNRDGNSSRTDSAHRTTLEVTNEVDYVVYLEQGTRRMKPRRMVGRTLAEASLIVAQSALELFAGLVKT